MNGPVKSLPFHQWHLLLLASLFFYLPHGFSQNAESLLQDTVIIETIPFEEIPAAEGETVIRANQVAETLLSVEEIDLLEADNDSVINMVSSKIADINDIELNSASRRYISNLMGQANSIKTTIENEKRDLSAIIASLNSNKIELIEDKQLWLNTDKAISDDGSAPAINGFIDGAIFRIDSVNTLIDSRSEEVLQYLERTIQVGLEVEEVISRLESELDQRQRDIFSITHPSVFTIEYSDPGQWDLMEYFQLFYRTDILPLAEFLKSRSGRLFFYLVFLVLLVFLFIYFRSRIKQIEVIDASFYENTLAKIISKPVSAALILGLYSSVLFFQNRPPVFKDLTVLIVTVPLIIIFKTLSKKSVNKYIHIFGILILLRFINLILPPEIILYRVVSLTAAIIELFVLLSLWRYISKQDIRQKLFKGFVQLLIIFHIITALTGITANLAGALTLAEMAVNFTIANALIGLLIVISAMIIIGLLHLAIRSEYMKKLNLIRKYGLYLKKRITGLISFLAVIIWFMTILASVNISDEFIGFFENVFNKEYHIGSASFTPGSVILFFFVIWLSVMVARIIKVVLEEDVLDKFTFKKGVPRMISVMVRYTLITLGVLLAVSAAGMPLDSLTIIFGAFSVGIGFGLQNIFNNLVSGLILLFERPVQIGDTVEVGNLIGVVMSMGIRSSNIKTFDGAEVIVPNGHLISNEVINWTLSDKRRRIEIISGVAYGSDVHKVQKLFMKVLKEHPDVLQDPAPNVYFNDLGESSLDFRLLFWTDNFDEWLRIRSEVVFKIHDILYAEGIEIPFPQRDLHIRSTVEK